jgi:hypothetical protein
MGLKGFLANQKKNERERSINKIINYIYVHVRVGKN